MKNMTGAVTGFLLVLSIGAAFAQQGSGKEIVRIKSMVGKVEIRSANSPKWRSGRIGMPVKMGWDIRTYVESRAELQFESGTIVKVGENSVITLSRAMVNQKAQSSNSSVKVATGKIWANVKKLTNQKSEFEFETPTAVASIRGTKLGINVGKGATSIDVYEGLVMVQARGGQKPIPVSTRTRAVIKQGSAEVSLEKVNETELREAEEIVPVIADDISDSAGTDTTAADSASVDSAAADSSVADSATADTVAADSLAADSAEIDTSATDTVETDTIETGESDDTSGTAQTLVLTVMSPLENAVIKESPLAVKGKAATGAVVTVNGSEVTVDGEGGFNSLVDLEPGDNLISISATHEEDETGKEIPVQYHPALKLNVTNVVDNMEVVSGELSLDIDVTEGAEYSVNGMVGENVVELKPGRNVVSVKAWDTWGATEERTFSVVYKKGTGLVLNVAVPSDGDIVKNPMIPVQGNTSPGAEVSVNGVTVPVDGSGGFSYTIPIPDEPQNYSLEIVASVDDEEITVDRVVTYEPVKEELMLQVSSPVDGQKIGRRSIRVIGKTSAGRDVTVEINGRRSVPSASGVFSSEVPVSESDIGEYT
ncbi:MAG: hypothetical protein GF350_06490, partial [Chitinivibrionales bacterium]|nr:hypothetical protein [Chitinivibrionales bacterium]